MDIEDSSVQHYAEWFILHLYRCFQAVFFTGDSDFLALVRFLRNDGKKVIIFSSKNNISHELKTGADGYIDILHNDDIWGNELMRSKK